jgi:HNH endonuclease
MTTEQKFWSKVDKQPNGCWLWTAAKTTAGYGNICDSERGGEKRYTHRYSWELHFGPIPDGKYVCHKCDVRNCVRPDHLFLGDPVENTLDALAKGRLEPQRQTFKRLWREKWSDRRGEGAQNHKLTEDQVREIRSTYKKGVVGFKTIKKRFGISFGLAQRIIARKTWKHI